MPKELTSTELDELITRAFQYEPPTNSFREECLSDETLFALLDKTLPKDQRQEALEHLDECHYCRIDLAFYCGIIAA